MSWPGNVNFPSTNYSSIRQEDIKNFMNSLRDCMVQLPVSRCLRCCTKKPQLLGESLDRGVWGNLAVAVMVRSLLLSLFLLGTTVLHTAAIAVGNLKTEYLTNPLGIDKGSPRFQWELLTDNENEPIPRGLSQVNYRIRVGTDAADGSVWDSGVVTSASSFLVKYAGPPLKSATVYVVLK